MKSILNIIITVVLVIIAAKVLFWAIPFIVLIGVAVWFYFKYKSKKIMKQYREEQERENINGYKFSEGQKEQERKTTTEEEINKEDKFNGTVIDVDFEDVKKD
ncbi:MAG: hypothetical protein ACRDCW_09755 [Sarcina sp.]